MLEVSHRRSDEMKANIWAVVIVLLIGFAGIATAQQQDAAPTPPQDRPGRVGMGMDFHGVGGQITAIAGSIITLQTPKGETAKVRVNSSTRLMIDRNPAKLSDFKVGDRVFAAGEQDKFGVWVARVMGQRVGASQRGGMMPLGGLKPEDNGKTFIAGEITKIDGTRLTVKKPDNTEQVIEVDDDTSFHNERRESITLPDIKPGEFVRGLGAVKNGVFVPKDLYAGRPRRPRQDVSAAPSPGGADVSPNQAAPTNGGSPSNDSPSSEKK
jgi:hypothetical protein